jgi:hypothetical protein
MKRHHPHFQRTLFTLVTQLQQGRSQQGGYVIVVVMAMVLALSTMVITAALMSKTDSSGSKASARSAAGFYAAEAGLNLRATTIKNTFVGYNVPGHDGNDLSPSNSAACRDSVISTASDGSGDFACDNSKTFQGQPVSTFVVDSNTKVAGKPQPTSITINAGEQFAGLNALEYRYDVTSVAFDNQSQPTASLQMRFKSRLVPLFQFAAFYDKDLEILPSPTMTLSGPVHTNGDMYTTSDGGGSTLTYNGQITVHGALYRGRKNHNNSGTCGNGTVKVNNGSSATNMDCVGGLRTNITDVSTWNGRIRLGVPSVTVPPPESFDPVSTSNYWSKADLRVVLKLDSSGNPDITNTDGFIQVRNADGSVDSTRTNLLMNSCTVTNTTLNNNISGNPGYNSSTPGNYSVQSTKLNVASTAGFVAGDVVQVGKNDSNVIASVDSSTVITLKRPLGNNSQTGTVAAKDDTVRKAVVSTSNRFYNFREGKYIRTLNVDVQRLLDCTHQKNLLDSSRGLNDTTEGGLVWFFTVDGPKSLIDVYSSGSTPSDGNNYGVRLYNGGTLQSLVSGAPAIQGLSVVSDQAAYVQGEYNCGTWNSTTSTCSYKKPAAIMADSINVLSNNWTMDDPNTLSSYPTALASCNKPDASNTRINAAFLAGTDVTGRQEGSGGQDNPYNGGLENYPRFHENWSGDTLTYRGSFVSLNKTRRVDGKWDDQCYGAPGRAWDYDTDFNNAANLPPLSPRFVYLRQERFSRDFERNASLSLPYSVASLFPADFALTMPTIQFSLFRF